MKLLTLKQEGSKWAQPGHVCAFKAEFYFGGRRGSQKPSKSQEDLMWHCRFADGGGLMARNTS